MEPKSKIFNFKQFSRMISKSSQQFLASFLDDSDVDQKEQAEIRKQIQLAIAQKSLVVLQIQDQPGSTKFETVSGWIISKRISNESIMLRLQNDPQQIRMITIQSIQKFSSNYSKRPHRLSSQR